MTKLLRALLIAASAFVFFSIDAFAFYQPPPQTLQYTCGSYNTGSQQTVCTNYLNSQSKTFAAIVNEYTTYVNGNNTSAFQCWFVPQTGSNFYQCSVYATGISTNATCTAGTTTSNTFAIKDSNGGACFMSAADQSLCDSGFAPAAAGVYGGTPVDNTGCPVTQSSTPTSCWTDASLPGSSQLYCDYTMTQTGASALQTQYNAAASAAAAASSLTTAMNGTLSVIENNAVQAASAAAVAAGMSSASAAVAAENAVANAVAADVVNGQQPGTSPQNIISAYCQLNPTAGLCTAPNVPCGSGSSVCGVSDPTTHSNQLNEQTYVKSIASSVQNQNSNLTSINSSVLGASTVLGTISGQLTGISGALNASGVAMSSVFGTASGVQSQYGTTDYATLLTGALGAVSSVGDSSMAITVGGIFNNAWSWWFPTNTAVACGQLYGTSDNLPPRLTLTVMSGWSLPDVCASGGGSYMTYLQQFIDWVVCLAAAWFVFNGMFSNEGSED